MFRPLSPGHHQVTSKQLPQILLFTCDLMMAWCVEAETCCHLVTLNKINIHNTRPVLTCESLLLTCEHITR
jgi:hypothetical protein